MKKKLKIIEKPEVNEKTEKLYKNCIALASDVLPKNSSI